MTFQFPGIEVTRLFPNGHDANALASAFKKVCIETGLARKAAGQAAESLGWGLSYRTEMMPFKNPVDIGGWYTTDAVVNVGSGMFFNKHDQCNLVGKPEGADREALVGALEKEFGAPANAKQATKKDGSPNKSYRPEWQVPLTQGGTASVRIMEVYGRPAEFMISALKKVEK